MLIYLILVNIGIDENLPCVRDFDSYTYAREYEKGFMIGWFEPEAKPAFLKGKIPKDWKKYLRYDWKHISKYTFVSCRNYLIRRYFYKLFY